MADFQTWNIPSWTRERRDCWNKPCEVQLSWDQSDQRTGTKRWTAANEQMWNKPPKNKRLDEKRKERAEREIQRNTPNTWVERDLQIILSGRFKLRDPFLVSHPKNCLVCRSMYFDWPGGSSEERRSESFAKKTKNKTTHDLDTTKKKVHAF